MRIYINVYCFNAFFGGIKKKKTFRLILPARLTGQFVNLRFVSLRFYCSPKAVIHSLIKVCGGAKNYNKKQFRKAERNDAI